MCESDEVISLAAAAVVASNQLTTTTDGSAPSDVLYVTIGSLIFVLLIVGAALAFNKREEAARSRGGSAGDS